MSFVVSSHTSSLFVSASLLMIIFPEISKSFFSIFERHVDTKENRVAILFKNCYLQPSETMEM